MGKAEYEVSLLFGMLRIRMISDLPLIITKEVQSFCADAEETDVTIRIKEMQTQISLPKNKVGEDLLLEYYYEKGFFLAAAKRGTKSAATIVIYTSDFFEVVFYVNEKEFPGMIRKVSKILQLLPIRQLLMKYHMMLLHSSRISLKGKAIIFTAPSQTGKTTQARLWKKHESAEIVSNDRSLLLKESGGFSTCGYPVDGSMPVYSNRKLPLGAIVVLCQGTENHVTRLSAGKALKYLMEQTVADAWNTEELSALRMMWIDLLEQYPVYQLLCTPDQKAVFCLKKQLEKDGVISFADN